MFNLKEYFCFPYRNQLSAPLSAFVYSCVSNFNNT